jgi:hypothetical protein
MKLRRVGISKVAAPLALVGVLSTGLFGCYLVQPWSPFGPSTSAAANAAPAPAPAAQWIGKTVPELTAKLGQPTSSQPLLQTTGQLIMYAHPGQPHYVFETGANGKIVSAVATN